MNWQETINWLDGLAAQGQMYQDNVRAGILALQNVPIPRPAVIEEKLRDWQFILDNDLVPERNAVGGSDGGGFSIAGGGGFLGDISPLTIGLGLLLAFAIFGRKKTRD